MHSFFVSRQQGSKESSTALVVDADIKAVHGVASALRQEGFAVLEATSFEEGKRLWMSRTPEVLVADIRLGQFNGLQLLMRARADRPDLRAVITCPFADVVLEAETRRFGATFLIKPVEPGQIVEAVRNTLPLARPALTAATPPEPSERRRTDRRRMPTPEFAPERRGFERRSPTPAVSLRALDRRRQDRRQMEIPGFVPDRRQADRRSLGA